MQLKQQIIFFLLAVGLFQQTAFAIVPQSFSKLSDHETIEIRNLRKKYAGNKDRLKELTNQVVHYASDLRTLLHGTHNLGETFGYYAVHVNSTWKSLNEFSIFLDMIKKSQVTVDNSLKKLSETKGKLDPELLGGMAPIEKVALSAATEAWSHVVKAMTDTKEVITASESKDDFLETEVKVQQTHLQLHEQSKTGIPL